MVATAHSRGAFLLEAVVSLVVIALTAAAIFGLLANGLRTSSNALARAAATDLAVSALARMAAEDPSALADRYDPHGAGFRSVLATAMRLPGVTETENVPAIAVTAGPSARSRHVQVTVFWQLPNETLPHRASMTSAVGSW